MLYGRRALCKFSPVIALRTPDGITSFCHTSLYSNVSAVRHISLQQALKHAIINITEKKCFPRISWYGKTYCSVAHITSLL